jgi:PKD repeat protein
METKQTQISKLKGATDSGRRAKTRTAMELHDMFSQRTKFLSIMKHFLFTAVILVLFAACKKKTLPESSTGAPVFMFSGNVNHIPVNYTAGDNTLYMHTEYYKDDQDLLTLKGFFSPYNCITCEPYLSFEFKDESPNIEAKLYSDIYKFFERSVFNSVSFDSVIVNSPTESFKFTPDNNPPGTTYFWDFGDGTSSNLNSPTHTFLSGGIKNVRLIASLNNLKDTIEIPIDVTSFSECRNKFYPTIDSNSITVNAEGLFKSHVWYFGDGGLGQDIAATHVYSNSGLYEVTLKSSNDQCLSTFKRKVNIMQSQQGPISNFYYSTYTSSETKLMPRVNNSACIITLMLNGKTYKSFKNNALQDQSVKKVITINSIAPYENNVQGEKTLQINGAIDLFLYNVNDNNDSIPIKSNQLSIAVAYPS